MTSLNQPRPAPLQLPPNTYAATPAMFGGTSTPAPSMGQSLADIKSANTWTVDPKTQTVAGQLEGIIATDSPLLRL